MSKMSVIIHRARIGRLQSIRRLFKQLEENQTHVYFCIVSVSVAVLNANLQQLFLESKSPSVEEFESVSYGKLLDFLFYSTLTINYLQLPIFFLLPLIFGMFCCNSFPKRVRLATLLNNLPTVCFRVVTKGDYPELVVRNLKRNIRTCQEVGLKNCLFEIVTEKKISGILNGNSVRQIVVPEDYQTKNKSKFKARNLQYCLEDYVNTLKDEDWILHLDEDSILTEDGVKGVANFVSLKKHQLGQGMVNPYNQPDSILTRLVDTRLMAFYVALNLGCRLSDRNPTGTVKASNLLCNVAAERDISFDFGPDASIFEECAFGLKAQLKGYTAGYVEGEMIEQGFLTMADLIAIQRRNLYGYFNIVKSNAIIYSQCKVFLLFGVQLLFLTPIGTLSLILRVLYPVPYHPVMQFFDAIFLRGITVFQVFLTFKDRNIGWFEFVLVLILRVLFGPLLQFVFSQFVFWSCILGRPPKTFRVSAKKLE